MAAKLTAEPKEDEPSGGVPNRAIFNVTSKDACDLPKIMP
jgi:hypothetical protein